MHYIDTVEPTAVATPAAVAPQVISGRLQADHPPALADRYMVREKVRRDAAVFITRPADPPAILP